MSNYITESVQENRCPDYDTSGAKCEHGCCWERWDFDSHCCSWAESVGDVVLALIGVASGMVVLSIVVCIICRFVKSKGHHGQILSLQGQSCEQLPRSSRGNQRPQSITTEHTNTSDTENTLSNTIARVDELNRSLQSDPRREQILQDVQRNNRRTSGGFRSQRLSNDTADRLPTVSDGVMSRSVHNTDIEAQTSDFTEPPPSYDSLFSKDWLAKL